MAFVKYAFTYNLGSTEHQVLAIRTYHSILTYLRFDTAQADNVTTVENDRHAEDVLARSTAELVHHEQEPFPLKKFEIGVLSHYL